MSGTAERQRSRVRPRVRNWKCQGACLDVARGSKLTSGIVDLTSFVVGFDTVSLVVKQNLETSRNVTTFQKDSVLDLILRLRRCMQTVTLDVEASDSIDNMKTQLEMSIRWIFMNMVSVRSA